MPYYRSWCGTTVEAGGKAEKLKGGGGRDTKQIKRSEAQQKVNKNNKYRKTKGQN